MAATGEAPEVAAARAETLAAKGAMVRRLTLPLLVRIHSCQEQLCRSPVEVLLHARSTEGRRPEEGPRLHARVLMARSVRSACATG